MNVTQYKWQQCGANNSFVYALNDKGVNDFCFVVQSGNNPEKERAVATLACAAPALLEALEGARLYVDMAGENCYNPVADKVLAKIDAAIAAAKGEV